MSLSCPLTPETRNLLSRARIARMKRGAIVVNAARGACMDEEALADALESGHVAAVALDVYEREPAVSRASSPRTRCSTCSRGGRRRIVCSSGRSAS